jgi:pyrroline-5-carboxylate reductase
MTSSEFEGIAILGAGNLGTAIAEGLLASDLFDPSQIVVTRRRVDLLSDLADEGIRTTSDNREAIRGAGIVLVCVQPQQLDTLLDEIAPALEPDAQVVVSTVSGATIEAIRDHVGPKIPVVRAMPNLGVAIRESMTCLAADRNATDAVDRARAVFETVGECVVIPEELMIPATALAAGGVAFFLRAIRAASQGGIEIGFHADEAIRMPAQTAKGAADLVLAHGSHPETEIDKVTTPRGCTIAGLNEMESRGFSSAMIRGILLSAERAAALYEPEGDR